MPSKLNDTALKAAKKALKKSSEGSMKLKQLCKAVVAQFDDASSSSSSSLLSTKQVAAWIQKSSKFHIDGKMVSYKRKRAKSPKAPQDELKRAVKRVKRSSDDDESTCESDKVRRGAAQSRTDVTAVAQWRQQNKIVVMDAQDDQAGQKKTAQLVQNPTFFPFGTFDACQGKLHKALIEQCTTVNGFEKPSPIQAQSWPILTQQRDVVGIAETGSGVRLYCTPLFFVVFSYYIIFCLTHAVCHCTENIGFFLTCIVGHGQESSFFFFFLSSYACPISYT